MEETMELFHLLVDAINGRWCNVNVLLSKHNVKRIILPRLNAKTKFPKT